MDSHLQSSLQKAQTPVQEGLDENRLQSIGMTSQSAPLSELTMPGLHRSLLPQIMPLEGLSPDLPILDLACGTGAWLKRLHSVGYNNLWGVDRDAQGFAAGDVAHFIPADLDCADEILARLGNRKFALATMIEIIEHMADPTGLVRLARDALEPGGWLLITSPNIYSLRARARFLLRPKIPYFESASHTQIQVDHLHPLMIEAYERKIFKPLGLSLTHVWTFPESGSSSSRWFARVVERALRLMLNDELSGDTICLLLRKASNETLPISTAHAR